MLGKADTEVLGKADTEVLGKADTEVLGKADTSLSNDKLSKILQRYRVSE